MRRLRQGAVNGSNAVFTLASAPSPAGSLALYRNGLFQRQGADYQISANTITFFLASVPQTGDLLVANYRFANPGNLLSSLASPQVVCSSTGSSTSGTALVELGSCTIPAGLLGAGDRLEVQFQYGHTGTATGFTGAVLIGRHDGSIASGGRDRGFADRAHQLRALRRRPDVGHADLGNRAEFGRDCGDSERRYVAGRQGESAGPNGGNDLRLSVLA